MRDCDRKTSPTKGSAAMMLKLQPAVLCLTVTMSLGLSACSGSEAASGDMSGRSEGATKTSQVAPAEDRGDADVATAGSNLADGPDVCFRAIAKHLGADTKVSEITSFFSAGSEIDSRAREPAGTMTICKVEYRNPDDPRKLLSTQLDIRSGEFGQPSPVEITVAGGNAAEFNIEDYLIPLSKIDAAALISVMDGQKAKLSSVYSRYAWSGVRLSAPGAFSNTHTLRLDLTGRLASNDIKEDGYASVTTDGKKITTNYLVP
jgi:hypothetical protein